MSISQTILDIAEICAQHGVKHLVVSPGSRNAPLTLAFSRHASINTRVISDERSAGYIALGIAKSLKQPVILLCTSGTAALNFGPAITEAFYQNVPLLVFTADRPPEWIDQNDGQSVRQRNIFNSHVKQSFELPVSMEHQDEKWQVHRIINEAVNISIGNIPGPVHINAPFREPLYPEGNQSWEYHKDVPLTKITDNCRNLSGEQWQRLATQWANYHKILVVGGQAGQSGKLTEALENLQAHASIPVVGDATSNLHQVNGVIQHPEIILGQTDETLETLQPDLLITLGGGLISKNLKLFLRKYRPLQHWHLQEQGYPADTFRSLSRVITMDPAYFFSELIEHIPTSSDSPWYQRWRQQQDRAKQWITEYLSGQDFNELQAVQQVLKSTGGYHLHVSNSTPVRWVDLLGVDPETIEVSANRGTSGIDGCSSTAVGHSMVNQRQNLLITGDMAFFYDRNAFWHNYQLPNLKIILLNNHGGGIFRLIDGPRHQPEREELFVTKQLLTAKNSARDFGIKYLFCNKSEDLKKMMGAMLEPNDHACLLEIEFSNHMAEIYQELKAIIKRKL